MNPGTGKVYPSLEQAIASGVPAPVQIFGTEAQVERISKAVRKLHANEQKKARRKQMQQSRRSNR